jgi:3',5'-cyclic-AMP phosphodiesterase
VQQAFSTEAGRFVLLDTHEPGRADGTLCRRRLNWLDAELRADQATPLFLFLHHPPFRVGLQRMDRIRLLDTLRPHLPRVRHLFIGHLHRTVAGSWHGIPFSGVRGTSHQIALDFITPTWHRSASRRLAMGWSRCRRRPWSSTSRSWPPMPGREKETP